MMIAARNSFLMGGVKPPYDAEVEYLESTGTQWIDLGFIPQDDTRITCLVGRNPSFYMGAQTAWERNTFRYNENSSRTYWVYGAVAGDYSSNIGVIPTGMHIVDVDGATCNVNGKTSVSIGTTPINCAFNFLYGALNTPTEGIGGACFIGPITCRLGGIYGDRQIDAIPVRVGSGSSAVGYLYDRANPTGGPLGNGLYGNAGTGAFVIGPDK